MLTKNEQALFQAIAALVICNIDTLRLVSIISNNLTTKDEFEPIRQDLENAFIKSTESLDNLVNKMGEIVEEK